jgi:signal transduction histidine kinase
MSTSIWGGPESYAGDAYPSALLKNLLKQMMRQFSAQGACFALFDESISQMRIRLHVRMQRSMTSELPAMSSAQMRAMQGRRIPTSSPSDPFLTNGHQLAGSENEELQELSAQQSDLFAPGTLYAIGQDLIGTAWEKNEAFVLNTDSFDRRKLPFLADVVPTSYLIVPVREPVLSDTLSSKAVRPRVLGVIVLYQLASAPPFRPEQRAEALQYTERIALYLQNDRLQRSHQRTSEYLQLLQKISTVFPSTVMLSELVEQMYQFTASVVDVSSMLLTIYDRDHEKIYDVFAIINGVRVNDLAEQPLIMQKEDRPVWWQVMQVDKRRLLFSPAQDAKLAAQYNELLTGVWGDQHDAQSLLILPLKMFNRVVGSLSIASMRPLAYRPEEIQVLETMLQIVTVSMENAKLYDRDHVLLQEARQRELQLAAINSALQSISSVLNVTELLKKMVESVAQVANVDTCVFFLLSPEKDVLVAQALHAPSTLPMAEEDSDTPEMIVEHNQRVHDDLIKMIRLPFQGTILEQMVHEGFFYLDAARLEELVRQGEEGCLIFLQETGVRQLLMIPMNDDTEFIGMLAVSTPIDNRYFRPKEIGMLLAICAQAVNAIRSAQLFEEREEAYAKLEQLNKLKDEFLVTASHELRTPLSAINGYSSLLKRHIQSPRSTTQQILRFVNKIARAAQQLSDQVDKMTEATKIGTTELVREPVQILSAVEIAASMLTQAIEQQIMLDVPPALWVLGDAPHLRQVLSNLLDNAAKYSSPNSLIYLLAVPTTLKEIENLLPYDQFDPISNENSGETRVVLVRVQDQGEGILPQDQQRIFEKFYRAPRSLTTSVRGSGLGLYISRRYIEAMGGRLWLEKTVPNEGSTFTFYLPQVEPPDEAEGQSSY